MKLTKSIYSIRLLLYIGLFVMLNLLAYQIFFRLDFTADKRYTLSNSTKNIVEELDELVTISAYVSSNLPPELSTYADDLKDMLEEYENYSDGNLVYEVVDPLESDEAEAEATNNGIATLNINSREADENQNPQRIYGGRDQGREPAGGDRTIRSQQKPRIPYLQGNQKTVCCE